MNPIERLRAHLIDLFPSASLTLDPPAEPRGAWFLDVAHEGRSLVVEWRPDAGFGLSAPSPTADDYGLGPEEVVADLPSALGGVLRRLQADTPRAIRPVRRAN
jgi:hypothetical protein